MSIALALALQVLTSTPSTSQPCGASYLRGGAQGGGYASGGDAKYVSGTASIALTPGWNLISNPVANAVPGDSVRQLFPTSSFPYAFTFLPASGYVQQFRAVNGPGYWAKFPGAAFQEFFGDSLLRDSVALSTGWNMVGSISVPLDTAALTTVPPGLRASLYYGFAGGYSVAGQIQPGKGYFVKSAGTGMLVFDGASAALLSAGRSALADRLNSITISDASGGMQTLYFGSEDGTTRDTDFEMPPLPPGGVFDARFESAAGGVLVRLHGREATGTLDLPLIVHAAAFPFRISWNVREGEYELVNGTAGTDVPSRVMTGEGEVVIAGGKTDRFLIRYRAGASLPAEYRLSQNYPNPFNPATTIEYQLPEKTHVVLAVYDIVGRVVADLVNEVQEPGYKTIQWKAPEHASGVYFCRLQAGTFTGIRKLVLLK